MSEKDNNTDEFFMRRAIELAGKGAGWTNPNPLVGAVIVKDGKIIGQGYHQKYGELHAERNALADCKRRGNSPEGASIYVTLEPCSHYGKQPPCSLALLEAGISRVFVGSRDPNPLVSGKGNAFLRENGIQVIEDFLREECDSLNAIFFHYITKKTPYIALKYAMTADGKIATKSGDSKWISGEKSRNFVQQLRNRYAAILCGIGTVLKDDPLLTCRIEGGHNPLRIICDSFMKIPLDSQIVKTSKEIPTLLVCNSVNEKKELLEKAGLEILLQGDEKSDKINFPQLVTFLGERKIDSLLIEGGGEINFSALNSGLVNKIYAFLSPKIFGGPGKSPVSGEGINLVKEAFEFNIKALQRFENDILLEMEK